MSTEEVELEGLDYIDKFSERLDIIRMCIKDRRDISENDYAVLEQVFRVSEEGCLPFYKTICTEVVTTSTQTDLFTANPSCSDNGTQFDFTPTNDKNKKK
jgi:hypothetical protein